MLITLVEPFKFSRAASTLVKPCLNIDGLIHRLACSDTLLLTFLIIKKQKQSLFLKQKTTTHYQSILISHK